MCDRCGAWGMLVVRGLFGLAVRPSRLRPCLRFILFPWFLGLELVAIGNVVLYFDSPSGSLSFLSWSFHRLRYFVPHLFRFLGFFFQSV